MDFRYTSEENAFRSKLHSWIENTSAEVFGRTSDGGGLGASAASLLDVGDDSRWQRLLEYHKRLYDSGYVALHWPIKEWSGSITTFAHPYSRPVIDRGPVYRFTLNHAVVLDEAERRSVFRTTLQDVR